MKLIHKVEISPGRYIDVVTEIPPVLLAGIFLAVTLSIYNLYGK